MKNKITELSAIDANVVEACLQSFIIKPTPPVSAYPATSGDSKEEDQSNKANNETTSALLNTIKLPRVLRQLADYLPKPNYESSLAHHHHTTAAYAAAAAQ